MEILVQVQNVTAAPVDVTDLFTPEAKQIADNKFRIRRLQQAVQQSETYSANLEAAHNRNMANQRAQIQRVERLVSQNTTTARNALTQSTTNATNLRNDLTNMVQRGQFQQVVNTQARRIDGVESTARNAIQQSGAASARATAATQAANAAKGLANAAKGLAHLAWNTIGQIGGAAGLLSLYGFFKATRPTLEAHDSRLDAQERALSQNLTIIGANRSIANRAEAAANQALQQAEQAQKQADQAMDLARHADGNSNRATELARRAAQNASNAAEQARQAQGQAQQAIEATRTNAAEITRVERDQTAMNEQQYNQLTQQNNSAIGQNNRLINLVTDLQTSFKEAEPVPLEFLTMPALLGEMKRQTNQIAQNTSASAQQANSRAGTCQAFAPSQCGDQAIRRNIRNTEENTQKIWDWTRLVDLSLLPHIALQTDRLMQLTLKMRTDLARKFAQTWSYLGIDRILNVVNTAASLHNAAMLSRNTAESLVAAVDGILTMIPLKDPEGNAYSFSDWISKSVEGFINATIGEDAARGISERWNRWNRIISSGAAIVMAVRSVQWAIAEGIEIMGNWIAKMGNGLREEGVVSDVAWPWMKEGIQIKRFSRLDRFNDGLESAESITNEIYATVAAGAEIADAVNGVRAAKQQFDTELATEETEAIADLDLRNTESASPDIEAFDLVKIEATE